MPVLEQPLAETRVMLHPVRWQTFKILLGDLGAHRGTRLAYCEEMLEIMTPLGEHEHNNRFIDDLIRAIADEKNLNIKKMGSLTLKRDDLQKGVEPDSCYYLQNEPQVRGKQNINLNIDPPPDLVLEIDITSGSLNKLPIYGALGVPEVWRYDGEDLTVWVRQASGKYDRATHSLAFPDVEIAAIPQFVRQSLIDGETATLREFRRWIMSV
ncbi:Uma2 family endonuclease [Lusitaniella coriacea]|uniref:Uma2 family endonuclease n=1 Tax=Lusitaniella coriacea TaxID=1983105 RepID=UPI003CE68DB6